MRCLPVSLVLSALVLASAGCREPNPLYVKTSPDSGLGPQVADGGGDQLAPAEDATTLDGSPFDAEPKDASPADVAADRWPADQKDVGSREAGADSLADLAPVPDGLPDLVPPSDTANPPADVSDDGSSDAGDDAGLACVTGANRLCPMETATSEADACQVGRSLCTDGIWSDCAPIGSTSEQICGLGVCFNKVAVCAGGKQQACQTALPFATEDGCGMGDEDCDGVVDEDCLSGCVHVSPDGVDAQADGTAVHPFRTIQAAVDWAAAGAARSKRVCVAGAETCAGVGIAAYEEALTIPVGISVQGGYAYSPWQSCGAGQPTQLVATSEAGVQFSGANLQAVTELSRFAITRKSDASLAAVAGVTVSGAQKVVLTGVFINDSPQAKATYGVRAVGGAEVQIFRSSIASGNGSEFAAAVQAEDSRVDMRENCDSVNAEGLCTTACAPAATSTASLGFRGPSAKSSTAASRAHVISLLGASQVSVVGSNSVCGANADHVVGIHVKGEAAGLAIRGNQIEATADGTETDAILIEDCGDQNPRISTNALIRAQGAAEASSTNAIRSLGACAPFIDSNKKISVQPAAGGGEANAIKCYEGTACHILGNHLVQVEDTANQADVAAIRCAGAGACPSVSHNLAIKGGVGRTTAGIVLLGADGQVEGNLDITGGCGTLASTGIDARSSSARLLGNVVSGASCAAEGEGVTFRGIGVNGDADSHLSVEGNVIDASGSGTCTGLGIDVDTSATPITVSGSYKFNRISAGACASRVDFREAGKLRPQTLQSNTFVIGPLSSPGTIPYQREGRDLLTSSEINSMGGGTTSLGNVVN